MAKNDEKKLAYLLYIETDLNQKEIAERVKVTEKTMSAWIIDEEWEIKKAANSVTRKNQIVNLLLQLKELNGSIATREPGKRYATSSESDTISKISKSIESLEKSVTLTDYIMVSEELLKYMMATDQEGAKEMVRIINEFIQQKAKELTR